MDRGRLDRQCAASARDRGLAPAPASSRHAHPTAIPAVNSANRNSGLTRILDKTWRHREGVAFWGLALLYLAPVWAYRYIPTQDGPSHLDNAQILKELGSSAAGYEAYFEVRAEPIPNWTAHLLLAGMLYCVPALTAEQLLVSLYILGFAGAF